MPRSFLAIDPGPGVLRWGWFLWVTWAVIGSGLLGEDQKAGGLALGVVLTAPFWALWLLWPLYRGWAFWSRRVRRARGESPEGNNYYEFDGRPVRVLFDEGRVFVVADDVFDALRLEGPVREAAHADVAARGMGSALSDSDLLAFDEPGLSAWLAERKEPEARSLARWLRQFAVDTAPGERSSGASRG